MLEECGEVIVEKRQSGVLFGTRGKSKWEDGGEWKWYENDDDNRYGRYKGEIENGKPNGQGTFTFPNGDKYVGEYKDGKRHGQGTYIYHDGRKYEGEFKDGKEWNGTGYKNGEIVVRFVNGKQIEQ